MSGATYRGIAGRFAAMHERNLSLLTQFVAPRYCDEPFPAYRFIPGCNPHPTADPRGHSYGAPGTQGPSVVWVAPQDWAKSTDYLYGCDLYNHAYWWEAHEAWEGLWQLTEKEGIQGRFLKGLIQMSACHLKRFLGHSGGVERLSQGSVGYLRQVLERMQGESYMGTDLGALVTHFEKYYEAYPAQESARKDHDPRAYPYLLLVTG